MLIYALVLLMLLRCLSCYFWPVFKIESFAFQCVKLPPRLEVYCRLVFFVLALFQSIASSAADYSLVYSCFL